MKNLANSTEMSDWRMQAGEGRDLFKRTVGIVFLYVAIAVPVGIAAGEMNGLKTAIARYADAWSSTHRVTVDWPEGWASGDYRKCSMLKSPPLTLYCQSGPLLPAGSMVSIVDNPLSNALTLNVRFESGDYRQPVRMRTCLNRDGQLTCKLEPKGDKR